MGKAFKKCWFLLILLQLAFILKVISIVTIKKLKDKDSYDSNSQFLPWQFILVVFLTTFPPWTLGLSLNKVH